MFTEKQLYHNPSWDGMDETNKRFEKREKFLAGCKAVGGEPVKKVAEEFNMSRQHVYNQKNKVIQYAESLDTTESGAIYIKLDETTIEIMILSLSLDCKSSGNGIQRFFETVFKKTISAGSISNVLQKAAEAAKEFDNGVDLSEISQGANDEIFQCGTPILVGVDPESTYIYLLEEASDCTAESWELFLDDTKDHGLELETSINDSGKGLMAGIPRVYPDIKIQADTFHAMYTMGKEVSKIERKAVSLIKKEDKILNNLESKKPRKKNKEKLEEIQPKIDDIVRIYDNIFILHTWLKELLSFTGYDIQDSIKLSEWILQEMAEYAESFPGLIKEIDKVRKLLPSLLSFIKRLDDAMEKCAKETGIPIEAFRLMYRSLSYAPNSSQSNEALCELGYMLGERYTEANEEFKKLLNKTKKASSMVENVNGRIRDYIEVKRVIPTNFFILLKVYFNTRRYHRSRIKERVGKSPLELLTGLPQPNFFEALGY